MKYFKATVLVGFDDEEFNNWSESADLTFGLANAIHNPENETYLIDYERYPINEEQAENLKYSVLTPEGGV